MAARQSAEVYLDTDKSVQGKRILLLDDMIMTGVTMVHMTGLLYGVHQAAAVSGFSLLRLHYPNAAIEEHTNSFLLKEGSLAEIADILNKEAVIINRFALLNIFSAGQLDFEEIIEQLSPGAVAKLIAAGKLYFGNLENSERLSFLEAMLQ